MKWLSDDPIQYKSEDKLNFENSVNILKKIVDESSTPITIGINGKWGSGKSSLMRLLKEKLEKESEYKLVTSWFDTWNFSNESEIWRVLMISLLNDLDPKNKYKTDKTKTISSIVNIGSITAKAYFSEGATLLSDIKEIPNYLKDIFSKNNREQILMSEKIKSVKNFKEDFEKVVKKNVEDNGKFVVFVDDLDRIVPDKVINMIEAIKTFLTCERCVFIIGCDYNYIDACIELKYKDQSFSGKDYLEKIVQIPFNVPSMGDSQFINFLDHLKYSFNIQEDFNSASKLIEYSIGKNPRKIKRLINLNLIVLNLNTNNELDNLLLFKLLCFKSKWSDLYKKFINEFSEGRNIFLDYERWALPKMSESDYTGYPEPEPELDPDNMVPPDPFEEYEIYSKQNDKLKERVSEELRTYNNRTDKIDSSLDLLKRFFTLSPFFPKRKEFIPYIKLIETIDMNTNETLENQFIQNMPSKEEITELVEKVIEYFDEQKIDRKYFNAKVDVYLPQKSNIQESGRIYLKSRNDIKDWYYHIIKSRDDLNVECIKNNLRYKNSKILWIISPWKFPKSMLDFANNDGNIYLTDIYLLKQLLIELEKSVVK